VKNERDALGQLGREYQHLEGRSQLALVAHPDGEQVVIVEPCIVVVMHIFFFIRHCKHSSGSYYLSGCLFLKEDTQ